jgi:signal transduction histidine kinase
MKRLMSSVMGLERVAELPDGRSNNPSEPHPSLSQSALWGELVAAVSVEAASRGVTISLDVEDDACELWDDPAQALRVFKNLTLAAVRLTARDACLRIRVQGSPEQQLIELESVCSGEASGRPRLYRAARSVPSEESFAVNAARSFLCPRGGSVEARYMQNLGIHCTVHVPRRLHAAG